MQVFFCAATYCSHSFVWWGEERQEVIIMDKTYEMDGACCNDDKDHMLVE